MLSKAVVGRTAGVCHRGLLCFAGLLAVLGLVLGLALLAPWWGGLTHAQEPTATTVSSTDTPEATETPPPTASPMETPTGVPAETLVPTETATPTLTGVPTEIPAPTETATPTPSPPPTETAIPTATTFPPTPTPTPYQGPPPPERVMALSLEGAAGWTTPTPVAQTSTDSTAPAMAIDSEGGIHVVWSEFLPSNPEIFYSRWNGSSWSVPVNLSHDAGQSRFPDITVDRNGTLYVVWEEFITGDAYFSYRDSSLNWSTPVNVTCGYGGGEPAVGVDNTGRIYVATGSRYFVITDKDHAGCRSPQTVAGGLWGLQLAVDEAGAVHFVGFTGGWAIGYRKLRPDSGWSELVNLSRSSSDQPKIAVEGNGRAHVVWIEPGPGQPGKKLYSATGMDGEWGAPVRVSDKDEYWPAIAVGDILSTVTEFHFQRSET